MSRHRLALAGLALVGVLGGCGSENDVPVASQPEPSASKSVEPTLAPVASEGPPERLKIPSLGVDANVLALGKAADGSQDVPKALDETGWWQHGSKPGEAGNTVIVGHTSSKSAGVFDDLGDLRSGDRIIVRARNGRTAYAVTHTDEVPVEDFGTIADAIYRQTGPSGLVLMTCGDWDGHDYDTTVIVRADIND